MTPWRQRTEQLHPLRWSSPLSSEARMRKGCALPVGTFLFPSTRSRKLPECEEHPKHSPAAGLQPPALQVPHWNHRHRPFRKARGPHSLRPPSP